VVATTVEVPVPLEVDEVHQQLLADAAHKAARMPAQLGAQPLGENHDVTARQRLLALKKKKEKPGDELGKSYKWEKYARVLRAIKICSVWLLLPGQKYLSDYKC